MVLNKADQVDMSQLMRVYGALMWSLGKVFNTPEVCRVYVGSFNTLPISTEKNPAGVELFRMEQEALVKDLREVCILYFPLTTDGPSLLSLRVERRQHLAHGNRLAKRTSRFSLGIPHDASSSAACVLRRRCYISLALHLLCGLR